MKYIVKKTKIIVITDDFQTPKPTYNSYEDALFKVAEKKIKTVASRIKNDILPQLIEVYRFINSLPKGQRELLSEQLKKSIGTLSYRRKAQKLGKIALKK